jgi:zinc transport system substrate-binding protein
MTHTHGAAGEHAHEGLAFTTWLDLSMAAEQATAVAMAMSRKKPDLKKVFESELLALKNDLQNLDRQLAETVSQNPTVPVLMSHPVYDYMVRRYNLNARAVHWEPDQLPTPEQLEELNQVLSAYPASWMIWEGAPVPAATAKLLSFGVESTVFDPCANRPEQGDFLSVMQENISGLETIFVK